MHFLPKTLFFLIFFEYIYRIYVRISRRCLNSSGRGASNSIYFLFPGWIKPITFAWRTS